MAPLWSIWWAWIVAGFALGVLEVILPGYIFMGFALSALIIGLLIGVGLLAGVGLPFLLMLFAVLALLAWFLVRRILGKHQSRAKIWERDINDNNP